MKTTQITLILISILFTFASCKKDKTTPYEKDKKEDNKEDIILNGGGESKVSTYGDTESHNMGLACASCHKPGGEGEGQFSIGGTVYDSLMTTPYPNTTVKLYTGAGGTGDLKYTFQVDGRGNFYSTQTLNVLTGLYPAVEGDLTTQYMSTPVTTGNCASCHGNTTSKIWTK